jgi:sugar phosphate isomerase/epimerase
MEYTYKKGGTIMDKKVSLNTDVENDKGYPFGVFRQIADAGFSHLHWGHQWNTDFIYSSPEIAEIKKHLNVFGLSLSDTHASSGIEKCWYSPVEYERIAGVELVKNRIFMTAMLGGDAVVLHPFVLNRKELLPGFREQGLRSLDELESFSKTCGVKIALENLFQADASGIKDIELENIDTLDYFFSRFSPDYLGFCWDIGHSIILGEKSFERCAKLAKERLSVMHLNDNRGDFDQHSAPFTWSDRWEWIAQVIASSPYRPDKPVLLEVDVNKNTDYTLDEFLGVNIEAGNKFGQLLEKYRK